jgi:hypothetical protein
LYHALRNSLESESKLAKRCIEINGEIRLNRIKIQSTLTHVKDFQKKSDSVVTDIKSAWDNTEIFKKEERDLTDQLDNI